jgi:hypothetical protein
MKCENDKCENIHDGSYGSGRFCSRSCANKRDRSIETRKKISNTLSHGKDYIYKEKYEFCLNCGDRITGKNSYKFCSATCHREYEYLSNMPCEFFPFQDFTKATWDQRHCRTLPYHALTRNLSYCTLFNRCIHSKLANFNRLNISSTFYRWLKEVKAHCISE